MKITVNGERLDVDFDVNHVPMATALKVERAAGRRYVEWEADFLSGGAEALAVLVWLAWTGDGRDVTLQGILDGKAEYEFTETWNSVVAHLTEQARARAAAAENPTPGAEPLTAPDGTPSTPSGTKRSSPST